MVTRTGWNWLVPAGVGLTSTRSIQPSAMTSARLTSYGGPLHARAVSVARPMAPRMTRTATPDNTIRALCWPNLRITPTPTLPQHRPTLLHGAGLHILRTGDSGL